MKAIINGKLVFPERICEGILLLEGDRIRGVSDSVPEGAEIIDAGGLYVGPGLFDQHCHGYKQCGECMSVSESVRDVAMAHLKHGTTQFLPSPSYGMKKERFLKVVDEANAAIAAGDTNVVGIHYEGPFTSPLHGASPENAWQYTDENAREILDRGGKNVKHITYAPELPHAPELEKLIKEYGIVSDIGHTHAGPEDIYRAVANGATIVTHLFDAMSNCHFFENDGQGIQRYMRNDPQDCTSDIVLGIEGLYYELICDSRFIHVTAPNMRMAYRCAGEDCIICISDATSHRNDALNPADYPPEDPRSATDLNYNDRGQLAGSRLTAAMSVQNFMRATGCDVRVGFKVGSTNSAKALKMYDSYGSIDEGKAANLIFVDEKFKVKNVIFLGNELSEIRG